MIIVGHKPTFLFSSAPKHLIDPLAKIYIECMFFFHIYCLLSSHLIGLEKNLSMPSHFLSSYKYFIAFRSYFPNYWTLSKRMSISPKSGVSRINQTEIKLFNLIQQPPSETLKWKDQDYVHIILKTPYVTFLPQHNWRQGGKKMRRQ